MAIGADDGNIVSEIRARRFRSVVFVVVWVLLMTLIFKDINALPKINRRFI